MPRETPVEQTNRRQKALTKMPGSLMMPGNDKKLMTPTFLERMPEMMKGDQIKTTRTKQVNLAQWINRKKRKMLVINQQLQVCSATHQLCMARR